MALYVCEECDRFFAAWHEQRELHVCPGCGERLRPASEEETEAALARLRVHDRRPPFSPPGDDDAVSP